MEFLTVGLLLLVPIVYLVLSVAAIQAGAFGVEGAARHVARIVADGARSSTDAGSIDRVVRVILDDYGIDADSAAVTVACETPACDQAGERVEVSVRARIALPLTPAVLGPESATSLPVEATATATVSRFAGAG
ncbi:TadE family protein [Agromyces sp. Marseille-Q5079]|uniref:TadE family protein n=1 Tax=Agromyces sp. Marseille-Q5079 TaxID=3439059 RepID=UPI003D9CB105